MHMALYVTQLKVNHKQLEVLKITKTEQTTLKTIFFQSWDEKLNTSLTKGTKNKVTIATRNDVERYYR